MTSTVPKANSAKKQTRMAREPNLAAAEGFGETCSDPAPPAASIEQAAQPGSAAKPEKAIAKASLVLDMLQQPAGATIEQMVAATGWLPHTTRAVLTGFKKKGHMVTSEKVGEVRTYRVTAASAGPAPTLADSTRAAEG